MPGDFDAVPTMAYAVSAYHRAKGKPGSKYWDSYVQAVKHVNEVYGPEAGSQLQDVVRRVSANNDDVAMSLTKFAKSTLATNIPLNKHLKNFLIIANENPEALSKYQYAFDQEDKEGSSAFVDKVRGVIR